VNMTFSENLSELNYTVNGYTFTITDDLNNEELLTNVTIFSYGNTTLTFIFTDMVGFTNTTTYWLDAQLVFVGSTLTDDDGDGINNTNDSITGFTQNIQTNINPLVVYVNGSTDLVQNTTNETVLVEFNTGSHTLIEFEDDLNATPLNLSEVIVLRDLTENESSMLLRGLHPAGGKNVTLTLTGNTSKYNGICVKDADIFSISQISNNCSGVNESYIVVDNVSTFGSYSVSSNGSNVTVGLTQFTAVKQVCSEDWYFTNTFSTCSGGSRSLIFADRNSCGTTHIKPSQSTNSGCSGGNNGGGGGSSSRSSGGFFVGTSDDDETPVIENSSPITPTLGDNTGVITQPDPNPTTDDNDVSTTPTQPEVEESWWSQINIGAILVSTNALVAYLTVFVLLGIVGAVFVVRQHAVTKVKPPVIVKLADDPYPQLTDYVRRELAKGISEKRLKLFLLKTEWNAEDIERAFEKAKERPY
jgi:hypothetical protein